MDPIWFLIGAVIVFLFTIIFAATFIGALIIGAKRATNTLNKTREGTIERAEKGLELSAERNQLLRELIALIRDKR